MSHPNLFSRHMLKKPLTLCILVTMIVSSVLFSSGCGKTSISKGADESVTSSLASDTLIREVTSGSTDAAIVTEMPSENMTLPDLDALFGPEQIDYTISLPAVNIGSHQIETEFTILDPEDGVTLSQEEIDRMDLLCKTMEEVTGLSFLNSKYGSGKKVTIHVYQTIGSAATDNTRKSMDIDVSCLENANFFATIHELVHILQFGSVYSGGFPFYMEGHAEFWTYKIAEHILDNNIEGLCEMIDLENESAIWQEYIAGEGDVTAIYEHDLDDWMDRGCYFSFHYSWPAYVYGRLFFLYLEDVYKDANAFLPIYARIPYAITEPPENEGSAGRKYMDMEPLKKMMMVAYSDDVFDNFYPWLREHEELLSQYGA